MVTNGFSPNLNGLCQDWAARIDSAECPFVHVCIQ